MPVHHNGPSTSWSRIASEPAIKERIVNPWAVPQDRPLLIKEPGMVVMVSLFKYGDQVSTNLHSQQSSARNVWTPWQ